MYVKNLMTKKKYLLHYKAIKKYVNGLFLYIGSTVIPPGRIEEVKDASMSEIDFLKSIGIIEIIKNKPTGIRKSKEANVPVRTPIYLAHAAPSKNDDGIKIIEDKDFVIITSDVDIVNKTKEREIRVEAKEQEIKEDTQEDYIKDENSIDTPEEVVEKLEELEDYIKGDSPDIELIEQVDIIKNAMKEMITANEGLSKTGLPKTKELSEKLGFEVSIKDRNTLYKEIENENENN